MATFPSYKPTYAATKKSNPKTRTTKFGDGYEQRAVFGLNQDPREWSLTFTLPDSDIKIIETFLDQRANDSASFDWAPPDEEFTLYKWKCEGGYSKEMFDVGVSRLTVTFQQVFEP